jgi:hypothetical protein
LQNAKLSPKARGLRAGPAAGTSARRPLEHGSAPGRFERGAAYALISGPRRPDLPIREPCRTFANWLLAKGHAVETDLAVDSAVLEEMFSTAV